MLTLKQMISSVGSQSVNEKRLAEFWIYFSKLILKILIWMTPVTFTILFIIFGNLVQFPLTQVKPNMISNSRNFICRLLHKLPNNVRLRNFGNKEILENSNNTQKQISTFSGCLTLYDFLSFLEIFAQDCSYTLKTFAKHDKHIAWLSLLRVPIWISWDVYEGENCKL